MPLARRFAFLTAGCPENGGARNRRVVARSFLGLVCMTCGAWPPCHKVGSLVYAGGDFTRDASGARVGGSAFKKGLIPQAVDRGGRSGYPKFSGRVIRVFKISGFENRYPKLQRVFQYPKIRVPGISGSGSGIPELPELLCWLHKNTYTLLN
jgi:hypothetical protein